MEVNVVDNFLDDYQFRQVEGTLLKDDNFPWFYNREVIGSNTPKDRFQFTHTFFDQRPPWRGSASEWFLSMDPILSRIGMQNLYRVKANLNTKTLFHRKGGYHTDGFDCPYTAIFYVNTNNGYTHIKGYGKVKSVANRIVIFDSNLSHSSYTSTNTKTRVVINFNYG